MRHGDLRKADIPRQRRCRRFVLRMAIGMHEYDGTGTIALGVCALERSRQRRLVERLDDLATSADAFVGLDDAFIQQFGQHDVQVEQPRPGLARDAQRIAKAACDDQQRRLAFALQQRVGGNRGSHLHAGHARSADRFLRPQLEQPPHALHGSVTIVIGVFRQQLQGMQRAVGCASDHVGKSTATVDPKLPASHGHGPR
jgi:hypothetical protein